MGLRLRRGEPSSASVCRTASLLFVACGACNVPRPGKRPFHNHQSRRSSQGRPPMMSFGVMGGNMQPQGPAALVPHARHGQSGRQVRLRRTALALHQGLEIHNVEQGMDRRPLHSSDRSRPCRRGSATLPDFWRGQFICVAASRRSTLLASSDSRRDGLAAGSEPALTFRTLLRSGATPCPPPIFVLSCIRLQRIGALREEVVVAD